MTDPMDIDKAGSKSAEYVGPEEKKSVQPKGAAAQADQVGTEKLGTKKKETGPIHFIKTYLLGPVINPLADLAQFIRGYFRSKPSDPKMAGALQRINAIAIYAREWGNKSPREREIIHKLCQEAQSDDLTPLQDRLAEIQRTGEGSLAKATDENGWNALNYACISGNIVGFDLLLNTANPSGFFNFERTDIEGNLLLHQAVSADQIPMFTHLLSEHRLGDMPNLLRATNADGETILHLAYREGNAEQVLQALSEAGVSQEFIQTLQHTRNHQGKLPEQLAMS